MRSFSVLGQATFSLGHAYMAPVFVLCVPAGGAVHYFPPSQRYRKNRLTDKGESRRLGTA